MSQINISVENGKINVSLPKIARTVMAVSGEPNQVLRPIWAEKEAANGEFIVRICAIGDPTNFTTYHIPGSQEKSADLIIQLWREKAEANGYKIESEEII